MPLSLEDQVLQEHEQIVNFVQENNCPSEVQVRKWLQDAVEGNTSHDKDLRKLLKGLGLTKAATSLFMYAAFKDVYEASLAGAPQDEETQLKRAGAELHEHGGLPCMRLHYYLVNYAMCGSYFFGSEPRSIGVSGYMFAVKHAWSGIGDWTA